MVRYGIRTIIDSESGFEMKVDEVVDRAIKDPKFAAGLAEKVSRLTKTGEIRGSHNDNVWPEILKEFAETPEELARLSQVNDPVAGSTWWTTTVATITTAGSTALCATTVATMTTMTTARR
jgi:hypothetical protein